MKNKMSLPAVSLKTHLKLCFYGIVKRNWLLYAVVTVDVGKALYFTYILTFLVAFFGSLLTVIINSFPLLFLVTIFC